MKKLLSIILACVISLSAAVIPASADEIYYPCYDGEWSCGEWVNPNRYVIVSDMTISNASAQSMDIYFHYGQFAISISNAEVSGTKVNGSYYEVWDGGDFIVSGTITLDLGDSGIWLDWHPYENGRDGGTHGYMMTNNNFQYQIIKDSDSINVVLNGNQLVFEQNPVILNDRVLVPMRAIFEALGATVRWEPAKRHHGDSAVAEKGNKNVVLEINTTFMSISQKGQDAKILTLDSPSIVYNDRTLVPVRAVSEAFDANVTWDGETKTVNISE